MLLALVASILVFFLDTRLDYFKPVRSVLSTAAYPVQAAASLPSDLSGWVSDFFQDRK
jgi:rod shape-determining protein MreC